MVNKSISVIIPAFNEEQTIVTVIEKIKQFLNILEIIVIDDGSTDNTYKLAQESGVRVIKHPYNLGNGASIKTGVRNSTGDFLLFMDADLQHPPEEIINMTKFIEEYDMIVGARTKEADVSKFRSIGNYILIKLAEYVTGKTILDITSGFRLVNRKKCLQFLHLFPNEYSYPTTLTLCFISEGYSIKYIQLNTIKKREYGKSHIKPFRDGLKFLMIILKIVTLYEPLKIFLPITIFLFLLGSIELIISLHQNTGIQEGSIIFFVGAIIVFCVGLLSQQIALLKNK